MTVDEAYRIHIALSKGQAKLPQGVFLSLDGRTYDALAREAWASFVTGAATPYEAAVNESFELFGLTFIRRNTP